MIKDEKLIGYFRELNHQCNNFLDNSYEQRFVYYILDQIEKIKNYIYNHHANNRLLMDFTVNIPEFDNKEIELITRSKIENLISYILFLATIPFSLSAPSRNEINYIEIWKEKTKFNERSREKARNNVIEKILIILNLTIDVIDKRK
ncbi:MAG: hypothetical protein M0P66_12470 [Salinivirgaceae bacterium]|nr:hypothetical protein [Salinivirgaceae bacterium]